MAWLSKAELASEAERLGVDISDLSFRKAQGVISKLKAEEGTSKIVQKKRVKAPPPAVTMPPHLKNQKALETIKALKEYEMEKRFQPYSAPKVELTGMDSLRGDTDGDTRYEPVNKPQEFKPPINEVIVDPLTQYEGKTVLISPEMAPTSIQLIKYDEELGDEILVEEKSFELGRVASDLETGTYKILGKSGKKTMAMSTLPKQNAQITYAPTRDIVPRVRFNGREGYLWSHSRLPGIKGLLQESGYYEKYKDKFAEDPAIWYSAGKLLTCDIGLVHSIFREIEDDVKRRKAGY